ncbi:MAG: hypothetical protein CMM85_12395 [Rhodothermaceae bacterium]|nr:hypothetical protein [Rhodothermaceae bacterium]
MREHGDVPIPSEIPPRTGSFGSDTDRLGVSTDAPRRDESGWPHFRARKGADRSKKGAEQKAAEAALRTLRQRETAQA